MINRKVMSMCVSLDYCKGWNDAVKEIEDNKYVVFINERAHEEMPEYYPKVGTVGKILNRDGDGYRIEWPYGSTSGDSIWFVDCDSVIVLDFGKDD